jgi:hypothetical protein
MLEQNYSPALLSPPDKRDYPVSAAMEISRMKLPESFTVWQPPVENQGTTGNCVAQALANIMECIEHQRTGEHQEYSVGYIYGKSSVPNTAGMIMRDACDVLVKEGDVYRALWECFEENPWCFEKRFFVSEYIKSQAKKVGSYVRLTKIEDVKAFMYKYNLPVLISAPTKAYEGGSGDGYHAVACYGWESEADFKNRLRNSTGYWGQEHKEMLYTNSWGSYWLDPDGKGNIAFNDIMEIWGIVPMENIKLKDIAGHWSETDVQGAVERGIIKGYEDNTFKPDQEITRAEVATIAMRIMRNVEAQIEQHDERIKVFEKMFGINTGN